MSKMSKKEFTELMTKLRLKYSQRTADAGEWHGMVASYSDLTDQFPREQLLNMFQKIHEFFPKFFPGCGEMAQFVRMTRPGPTEAWPELLRLASRSSGDHSDPIAREAIRLMGGGKRLGQMDVDELATWGRKRFESLYAEIAEKQRIQEKQGRLMLDDGQPSREVAGTIREVAGKLSMEAGR